MTDPAAHAAAVQRMTDLPNNWKDTLAELVAARARIAELESGSWPRDAEHAEEWLYERAESAAAAGLPLDDALQAVRDGYSSIDADRMVAEDP